VCEHIEEGEHIKKGGYIEEGEHIEEGGYIEEGEHIEENKSDEFSNYVGAPIDFRFRIMVICSTEYVFEHQKYNKK